MIKKLDDQFPELNRRSLSKACRKSKVVALLVTAAAAVSMTTITYSSARIYMYWTAYTTNTTINLSVSNLRDVPSVQQQRIRTNNKVGKEEGASNIPATSRSILATKIWTYPVKFETTKTHESPDLCVYHTCLDDENTTRLNLDTKEMKSSFSSFWSNHHIYKVRYGLSFVHHVQAIAVLTYVKVTNLCAKTAGRENTICPENLRRYESYNPLTSELPPADLITELNISVGHFNIFGHESRVKKVRDINSGDEVQTFPAIQFMPYLSGIVDRDQGLPSATGNLFGNAWMGDSFKFPPNLTNLDFVLSSVHYSSAGMGVVKSNKRWFQEYNEKQGLVGARDTGTLSFLLDEGIQSYMSGCFTLMIGVAMQREINQQKHIIVVDVKKGFLPTSILEDPSVEYLKAEIEPKSDGDTHLKRMEYAFSLIQAYSNRASMVITSRIHAALPAIGLGVPVIFVDSKSLPGGGGGRTRGLSDVFRVYEPGTEWTFNNITALEPLYGLHIADRWRASAWDVVRKRSRFYYDSARLFQMIPIQRLGRDLKDQAPLHNLFHFMITKPVITWRMQRAIEFVFYHHPNAHVLIHTELDIEDNPRLLHFQESGYSLSVRKIDFDTYLLRTARELGITDSMRSALQEMTKTGNAYSHKTDLMRFAVLFGEGGVYLDTDMYLLQPLPLLMSHCLGLESGSVENGAFKSGKVNGAILIFERQSSFMRSAFVRATQIYKASGEWAQIGPALLTELVQIEPNNTFTILPQTTFYPYRWQEAKYCFSSARDMGPALNSYSVHLNTKITHNARTEAGSVCAELLSRFCIFCNDPDPNLENDPNKFRVQPRIKT